MSLKSKLVKGIGVLIGLFILLAILGSMLGPQNTSKPAIKTISVADKNTSVEVGGWNFTTNLAGWKNVPYMVNEDYDVGTGYVRAELFRYPSFPKVLPNLRYRYSSPDSGSVDIYVAKIPDDLKGHSLKDILSYATQKEPSYKVLTSEKDITFNGRQAMLSEGNEDLSTSAKKFKFNNAAIAMLLDNDTIGLIYSDVLTEPSENGEAIFNGDALYVLNSITISSKGPAAGLIGALTEIGKEDTIKLAQLEANTNIIA